MADNATITIRVDDGGYVFVDCTCAEDEDLSLVEALGMIELAKAVLMSEDDQ